MPTAVNTEPIAHGRHNICEVSQAGDRQLLHNNNVIELEDHSSGFGGGRNLVL